MNRQIQRLSLVLILALVASVFTLAAPAQPAQAQIQGASAVVIVPRANVYAGPGRGFWFVGTLARNTTVPVIAVSADRAFWYVNTEFGSGYLRAQDVRASGVEGVSTVEPGVIATITAGRAAVRGGPGIEAQQVATLPRGSQVYVIGRQPDGRWLEIAYRFGTGWVAASLTNLSTGIEAVEPSTQGPIAVVRAEFLNVRSGPGAEYTTIGSLGRGDIVPIVGRTAGGTWLLVEGDFGVGWINIIYVTTRNYFGSAPITEPTETGAELALAAVTRTAVNVRTGPNLAFESIGSVPGDTELTILGQSADRRWWYVNTPVGKGWVSKTVVRASGAVNTVPVVP